MRPELALDLVTSSSRLVRYLRFLAGGHETGTTWRALAIIAEDGPMRVTEFATADRLTQPSATALLRRLDAEGLIRREQDPTDRRAVLVEITDAGRARLAGYRADATAAIDSLLDDLDEDELETLARAVTIVGRIADTGLRTTTTTTTTGEDPS